MDIRNYKLTNACIVVHVKSFPGLTDKDFFAYLENLSYLQKENYYFIFQREENEEGEHWQLYIELNKQQYFTTLRRDFRNSKIEPRKKTQEQAINYCKKKESRINGPYEKGIPKRFARTRSSSKIKMKDSEDSRKQKLTEIIEKIRRNSYRKFIEIKDDDHVFFAENVNFLKNIWNEYHPVEKINVKACRVIWVFGKARAGKSIWTKKYLRKNKWNFTEIAQIFPRNMTYNDRVIFKIPDENKKVLIINEVDENFPKNNNLIAFIDRNAGLTTEKSEIENNFELIIINSVLRPEEIFAYLGKRISGQILGRIFNPYIHCEVYEIQKNEKQLEEILRRNLIFYDEEFQDWYQPIVKRIIEPDYSLIEKE